MTPINTEDPTTLLRNLQAFLSTAGVARAPRVAGSVPPIWLDPQKGVPYPGQTEGLHPDEVGQDVVLAAYRETGIPSKPFEGFIRQDGVTIFIRARKAPMAYAVDQQIRELLHDKRNYSLNGLLVNQSMLFKDLQRLGADAEGFVYNCEYMFDLWSSNP